MLIFALTALWHVMEGAMIVLTPAVHHTTAISYGAHLGAPFGVALIVAGAFTLVTAWRGVSLWSVVALGVQQILLWAAGFKALAHSISGMYPDGYVPWGVIHGSVCHAPIIVGCVPTWDSSAFIAVDQVIVILLAVFHPIAVWMWYGTQKR